MVSGHTSPESRSLNTTRRGSLQTQLAADAGQPSYPRFRKSKEKFLKEVAEAKKSGDYSKMVQFYGTAFHNFANLNAVFKVESLDNVKNNILLALFVFLYQCIHEKDGRE